MVDAVGMMRDVMSRFYRMCGGARRGDEGSLFFLGDEGGKRGC